MPQCKFSLYLKKAGLASRNIVRFLKEVFYVVSVSDLYLLSRSDHHLTADLIQRVIITAGLSSTVVQPREAQITQFGKYTVRLD